MATLTNQTSPGQSSASAPAAWVQTSPLQASTYANQNLDDLYGQMPPSEVAKIQNARCPPPLSPSYANAKIVAMNALIATQKNALASLEAQITALEKRYKINFSINQVNYYADAGSNKQPQMSISGPNSYPLNPQLSFTINQPVAGPKGPQGPNGPGGPKGISGDQGQKGPKGYWGVGG